MLSDVSLWNSNLFHWMPQRLYFQNIYTLYGFWLQFFIYLAIFGQKTGKFYHFSRQNLVTCLLDVAFFQFRGHFWGWFWSGHNRYYIEIKKTSFNPRNISYWQFYLKFLVFRLTTKWPWFFLFLPFFQSICNKIVYYPFQMPVNHISGYCYVKLLKNA